MTLTPSTTTGLVPSVDFVLPSIPEELKIDDALLKKNLSENIKQIAATIAAYANDVEKFVEEIVRNKQISKSKLRELEPELINSTGPSLERIASAVNAVKQAIFFNLSRMSHFESVLEGQTYALGGGSYGISYRLQELDGLLKAGTRAINSCPSLQEMASSSINATHLEQLSAVLGRCVSLKERVLTSKKELDDLFKTSTLDFKKIDKALLTQLESDPEFNAIKKEKAKEQYFSLLAQLTTLQENARSLFEKDAGQIETLQKKIDQLNESMETCKRAGMAIKKEEEEQIAVLSYYIASIKATSSQTDLRLKDIKTLLDSFALQHECSGTIENPKAIAKSSLLALQDKIVKTKEEIKVRNSILFGLSEKQKALFAPLLSVFMKRKQKN